MEEDKKRTESEGGDSSYDSDCEVSNEGSHYDVSRTVSDTLAQEFAEYVTLDSGYSGRVEFAKKLGYTEEQVRTALSKLGAAPSQNELLSELILLDSSSENASAVVEIEEKVVEEAVELRDIVIDHRYIVIDGSNVAMSHGQNKTFSCKGIQLAVDYFRSRGHKQITVFVPSFRREDVDDKEILSRLEKEKLLVYTPSRVVNNRRLVCYDDRYILNLAVETDGIVVSNDNYRDLTMESGDFKRVVEERLLMYSFVSDRFMPPEDPLGRNGPTLTQFLSKNSTKKPLLPCPYGKKCTYGIKCKYYHSTQQKSVSETLRKKAAMKTQSVPIQQQPLTSLPLSRTKSAGPKLEEKSVKPHKKLMRQLSINPGGDPRINNQSQSTYLSPFPNNPTLSEVWCEEPSGSWGSGSSASAKSDNLFYHLKNLFPEEQVRHVMQLHPTQADPGFLVSEIVKLFN